MSPEMIFSIPHGCLLLLCGLLSLIVPFGWTQQRNKPDEFNCPEEFGYYPHPTDCTQYYICVFGGALLESCTGGLMYSHDLQTCDWPRNVGCGASVPVSVNNLEKVGTASRNPNDDNELTTVSWKHETPESNRNDIPDRHLYDEENLPLDELENDRQQRVYRGQPSTLSQVAKDRDGGGVIRHANALQTLARLEKMKPLAVVSFGSHHQSLSGSKNETKISNKTSRGIRGYALRFRPHHADLEDSSVGNINSYDLYSNKINRSSYQHSTFSPISSTKYLTSATNLILNWPTPPPLKILSYPLHSTSNPFESTSHLNELSFVNTQHNNVYDNPSLSESMHYDRFSNLDDKTLVVTDFTIVNVVPTSQRPPFGIINRPVVNTRKFEQPFHLHRETYMPLNGVSTASSYPHPYYFYNGNTVNTNYKPVENSFIHPPLNFPSTFHDPRISIVALSYPKSENNSIVDSNFTNKVTEITTEVQQNVTVKNHDKNMENKSEDVQKQKHDSSQNISSKIEDNIESNDKNRIIISNNDSEDNEYHENEEANNDEPENEETESEEIEQTGSSAEYDQHNVPDIGKNTFDYEVNRTTGDDFGKQNNEIIKNAESKDEYERKFKSIPNKNDDDENVSKNKKNASKLIENVPKKLKENKVKKLEAEKENKLKSSNEKYLIQNDDDDLNKKNTKWEIQGYNKAGGIVLGSTYRKGKTKNKTDDNYNGDDDGNIEDDDIVSDNDDNDDDDDDYNFDRDNENGEVGEDVNSNNDDDDDNSLAAAAATAAAAEDDDDDDDKEEDSGGEGSKDNDFFGLDENNEDENNDDINRDDFENGDDIGDDGIKINKNSAYRKSKIRKTNEKNDVYIALPSSSFHRKYFISGYEYPFSSLNLKFSKNTTMTQNNRDKTRGKTNRKNSIKEATRKSDDYLAHPLPIVTTKSNFVYVAKKDEFLKEPSHLDKLQPSILKRIISSLIINLNELPAFNYAIHKKYKFKKKKKRTRFSF